MTDSDTTPTIPAKYAALDQLDRAIMNYLIQFPGISYRNLGLMVGLDRREVSKRAKTLRFQQAYEEATLPARELLDKKLDTLTRKYLTFCNSTNEIVAERATRAVLLTYGILKDKPDGEGDGLEPMIIELPSRGKIIEIKDVKALPKEKT